RTIGGEVPHRAWHLASPAPTSGTLVVPNTVHYVWFGEAEPMKFHQFLSIKSAFLNIRPKQILFHCDFEPVGLWWKETKRTVTSLEIVHRNPPVEIFGNEIIRPTHKSDVARLEILFKSGGIFLGTDVIVLKSFDSLRHFNFTMGVEYHGSPGRLNNDIIIANKDAKFLKMWYESYRNFTKREWDFHACQIPYNLLFENPKLIHVEERTLNYPSGKDKHLIYNGLYNWRTNFALHLWQELNDKGYGPNNIRNMNTTFGEVARLIYYGNFTQIKS
ncbi:uncharacterized protein LOC135502583, partial [Lineus longissimus]|uniref:uncharacterized protein LOC135502583 n=1 Tax=Lineus longissimus TaxID=88925 RepID=UPI00315D22F6